MRCFKHSNGTVFSFAFDPINKLPCPDRLFISDEGGTWEQTTTNSAGDVRLPQACDVSHVREINGVVVAWAGSKVIVLRYIGGPIYWAVETRNGVPEDIASALCSDAAYLRDLAKAVPTIHCN
jgi:hypothetical protein